MKLFAPLLAFTLLLSSTCPVLADSYQLELELGKTWQAKNDIQLPNDASGDLFSMKSYAGNGPWTSARVNFFWKLDDKQDFRLVLAPFAYSETGVNSSTIRFDNQTFNAGQAVKASYKFNSWRAGYRYQFHNENDWRLWIGGTLKIRDAEIKLQQAGTTGVDDDLGIVPLLYFAGEYDFNPNWQFQFEFDGLAGGPGRAIDLALKLAYQLDEKSRIAAGYRTLEGGVDIDDVYNFAWFHTAMLSYQYNF